MNWVQNGLKTVGTDGKRQISIDVLGYALYFDLDMTEVLHDDDILWDPLESPLNCPKLSTIPDPKDAIQYSARKLH